MRASSYKGLNTSRWRAALVHLQDWLLGCTPRQITNRRDKGKWR